MLAVLLHMQPLLRVNLESLAWWVPSTRRRSLVVGTKVATKVLKDGDEVEVDAEKGLIRVLSR
jgi:phosphohistidine swiveling domain-containing protein